MPGQGLVNGQSVHLQSDTIPYSALLFQLMRSYWGLVVQSDTGWGQVQSCLVVCGYPGHFHHPSAKSGRRAALPATGAVCKFPFKISISLALGQYGQDIMHGRPVALFCMHGAHGLQAVHCRPQMGSEHAFACAAIPAPQLSDRCQSCTEQHYFAGLQPNSCFISTCLSTGDGIK